MRWWLQNFVKTYEKVFDRRCGERRKRLILNASVPNDGVVSAAAPKTLVAHSRVYYIHVRVVPSVLTVVPSDVHRSTYTYVPSR